MPKSDIGSAFTNGGVGEHWRARDYLAAFTAPLAAV